MAKFVFRMQSYLGVKEQIEEQKKNEYGQALKRLEDERQKKYVLELEKTEMIRLFQTSLERAIKPIDIKRYNNRLNLLKIWIDEQEKRIETAAKYAEEKRLQLVEAMKERKALETVKERNFEEYLKEEQREEQRVVDGIVSYQYGG